MLANSPFLGIQIQFVLFLGQVEWRHLFLASSKAVLAACILSPLSPNLPGIAGQFRTQSGQFQVALLNSQQ